MSSKTQILVDNKRNNINQSLFFEITSFTRIYVNIVEYLVCRDISFIISSFFSPKCLVIFLDVL